jgi:hypothetical protein
MTRVVLDDATLAQLVHVTQTVDLCDGKGRVVGHFVPLTGAARYVGREPDITEEELRRREHEGGGRPLAEIMRDLEKLA